MLKKFGLLIAFVLSLAGCGKDTKTASADNKKADAPLVGCYARDGVEISVHYLKISEDSGNYKLSDKGGKNIGEEAVPFKLFEGAQEIEKLFNSDFGTLTEKEQAKSKDSASAMKRLLHKKDKSGVTMFFESNDNKSDVQYALATNMLYPYKKIDCPK